MTGSFLNLSAYRFVALADAQSLRETIQAEAARLGLKGTVLLAEEGINLFVAGAEHGVREWLAFVRRRVAGRPVFRADSGHIHHRLLRLGLSARGALLALWGLCAVLGVAAVLLSSLARSQAGWFAIGLAVILFAAFEWIEIVDARRLTADGRDSHDPSPETPTHERAAQNRGR